MKPSKGLEETFTLPEGFGDAPRSELRLPEFVREVFRANFAEDCDIGEVAENTFTVHIRG